MFASKTFSFIPSDQRLCAIVASIITLGTATLVMLAAAAVIAATYVLSLALNALGELAHLVAVSYNHADPVVQLIWIIALVYLTWKIVKSQVRPNLCKAR